MIDRKQIEEVSIRTENMTKEEIMAYIADLKRQIKEEKELQVMYQKAIEKQEETLREIDYKEFHEGHRIREMREMLKKKSPSR